MGQDPEFAPPPRARTNRPGKALPKRKARKNSIIVVIATDAPLLPNQLKRLARRATARHRPDRDDHRRRLGRALHRVHDREPRRLRRRMRSPRRADPERQHGPVVRGHRPGHGGGDSQRPLRRQDGHGLPGKRRLRDHGRPHPPHASHAVAGGDAQEVQPVSITVSSGRADLEQYEQVFKFCSHLRLLSPEIELPRARQRGVID